MEQLNQHISDKVPPPPLSSKQMFIVLLLFAILSGIIGYLIGIKTSRNEQNNFSVSPTISLTQSSVPSPTTKTSETSISLPPVDTTNWQTYSNSSLGLRFNYPASWTVDGIRQLDQSHQELQMEAKNCETPIKCETMFIHIDREDNPQHLTVPQLLKQDWPSVPASIQYVTLTNAQNVTFTKTNPYPNEPIAPYERELYALHGDKAYIFVTMGNLSGQVQDYNTPTYLQDLANFDHFIQTVSFTK